MPLSLSESEIKRVYKIHNKYIDDAKKEIRSIRKITVKQLGSKTTGKKVELIGNRAIEKLSKTVKVGTVKKIRSNVKKILYRAYTDMEKQIRKQSGGGKEVEDALQKIENVIKSIFKTITDGVDKLIATVTKMFSQSGGQRQKPSKSPKSSSKLPKSSSKSPKSSLRRNKNLLKK